MLVASTLSILTSSAPNHNSLLSDLANTTGQRFPLEINPDPIDLGSLSQGESARASLRLRNCQDDPVTLARVETSCPCIAVDPLPILIAPRETQAVTVSFDPSSETNFQGGLRIDVVGYDKSGLVVLKTRVGLEVRTKVEFGEDSRERDPLGKEGQR